MNTVNQRIPLDNLRTAWLLLLLRGAPSHGYELRGHLRARGIDDEPGALYRTLRKLEDRKVIVSRWTGLLAGPRRRVYTLTPKGHIELERMIVAIGAARHAQTAFLSAYDEATRKADLLACYG